MADKEITINITTTADTAEIEDLKDRISETQTETDNASESISNLGDSVSNVQGENIDNVTNSSDELGDSVSNTTTQVEGLNGSLGIIESSSLLALADQLGSIGSNAEGMAQEMNTAAISVGQLSTNVGMAEPEMVNLISYISNATFPQNEAMAYVNALNQMGVSANNLSNAATNMDKINDATGIGYQKTMQLTQGLQSVGISADNLPASFNAIAYAQANVNGGADTLSMVLKKQAATINEYGLNVDQLVLIMQALSAQGVQGMKMGSELSKVLKETNGDTTALEQSLGLTAGTLSNASEATGQYSGVLQNLADEEAEHKTIVDQLGAAWEDMALQLSPVISPMASIIGMVGQFGQFAMQVNGIIKLAETFGILKTAEGALIPVQYAEGAAGLFSIGWIVLAIALGIALGYALIWLYEHNENFRNTINALGETIQWLINQAWMRLQEFYNYLMQLGQDVLNLLGIEGNNITTLVTGVIAFIATMPVSLGIIFANAIAKVLGFGDNFTQRMWGAARDAYNKFKDGISGLRDLLSDELDAMMKKAEDFALNIPHPIAMAAKAIKTAWGDETEEHSPGAMYYMLLGELEAMDNISQHYGNVIPANMGNAAGNMVANYNNNFTGLNPAVSPGGNGGGDMIFNIYGDVDEESKMKRFAEYIRRELYWNNETAGRTVNDTTGGV